MRPYRTDSVASPSLARAAPDTDDRRVRLLVTVILGCGAIAAVLQATVAQRPLGMVALGLALAVGARFSWEDLPVRESVRR